MNKTLSILFPLVFLAGCGQPTNDEEQGKAEQRVEELQTQLAETEKRLEARVTETVSAQSDLAAAHERVEALEAEIAQLKNSNEANDEGDETSIDGDPAGGSKTYGVLKLITNMSGPTKSRYISVDLVCEGAAHDFEKIMEENDFRLRNAALQVLASYGYEESQQDGFIERVQVDLRKRFDVVLQKHRDGDSPLITKLFFTEFVIQ
jgi:flagellar basal body-associated protein FliL/outer membrane murein-binding lipoprotein Lpp